MRRHPAGARRPSSLPLVLSMVVPAVMASGVPARARPRPHFEPTDLDLEDTGVIELDLQLGPVRGPDAWRVMLPDFELDLGLLPNLELGLDGAYAIEGAMGRPFSFDHPAPDSLWPSVKVGLLDSRRDDDAPDGASAAAPAGAIWALGAAVGPKLPVTAAARGVGFEAVVLLGCTTHHNRLHTVLNLGTFVEPHPEAGTERPAGLEGGVDLSWDATERLQFLGELAGAAFLSSDPRQAVATGGASWAATDTLSISVVGLVGLFPGADHFALLLGVAPKLRLFGR